MNEWISVKDKLPEKDNWKVYAVITCQRDLRKYQMAWFQYSDKTFRLESSPNNPLIVTHWMELPPLKFELKKPEKQKCAICSHELQHPAYCDYCAMEIKT